MRKFLTIILCVAVCASLIGCAKLIDTKQEIVEVEIVDKYYRSAYTTFAYTGKVMVPIHHAASYRITVKYDGIKYDFGGSDTYHKYHDRIGCTVNAILETRTYDDGTVKRKITTIGVEEAKND